MQVTAHKGLVICELPPQPIEQNPDELTGWETIVFELDDEEVPPSG